MKTIFRSGAILALFFLNIPIFAQVYHSVSISGNDVICGNGQELYGTDYSGSVNPTWSVSNGQITGYGQNNTVWVKWTKSGTLSFHAEEIISEIITDPPNCHDENMCDYDYDGIPYNCWTIQVCDNPPPRQVEVLHIYDGTFTIVSPFAKATIQGDAIVCQGQLVNIVGEVTPGSLQWNLNGAPIPGATSSSYAASQSGNYTITTSSDHCEKTSNPVYVTVNPVPPVASVSIISLDQFPRTYSLNAFPNSGYSYQWQLNEVDLLGKTSYTCPAESSGSYTVRLTNSNSCSTVSDPTPVTVVPSTEATITGENSVCVNAIEVYRADQYGPEPITWSVSGGGQILEYVSNNVVKVQWTGPGTIKFNVETRPCHLVDDGVQQVCHTENICDYDYDGQNPFNCRDVSVCDYVDVTHEECSDQIFYGELAVNVNGGYIPPIADISIHNSDQFPRTYSLTASPSSGYSYQWQLNGIDLPGRILSTCDAESTGDYTVRLTSSNELCSTLSGSIPVTVVPSVNVTITGEHSVCPNTTILYVAAVNYPETTWSISEGGQIIEYVSNNVVKVQWTGPGTIKFNVEASPCHLVDDGVQQVCHTENICDYDYDGQNPFNCRDISVCDYVNVTHEECSDQIFYGELAVDINGNDNAFNWIDTRTFDGTKDGSGNLKIVSESKSYFDFRGQNIQSQTKNFSMEAVFASETIRDQYDRVVGSTLSAPIAPIDFRYCPSTFFLNKDGGRFTYENFGDATVSTETRGTLGNYYSSEVTWGENNVPTTSYPYSRIEFYEDGTGEVKRSASAGDQHRLGKGHEMLSGTFPVFHELDDYLLMRRNTQQVNLADNLTNINSLINHGVQSVVRDQNGKYAISITDKSGKTVMSARLGTSAENVLTVANTISSSGDPVSTNYRPMTYFYILQPQVVSITGSTDYVVEDIINNTKKAPGQTFADASNENKWPVGFYRILLNNPGSAIQVSYTHYLLDVSYQFYDDAGRLKSSISPNGYVQLKKKNVTYANIDKTTYQYNYQGWLLAMTEPDAGTTNYTYRRDGKIRFSQNALQHENEINNAVGKGRFSYTNYDALGRPVESGEYTGTQSFSSQATQVEFDAQVQYDTKKDWVKTYYDIADADFSVATKLPADYGQNFVRSAVSHTANANIHTWYSYDEMGRVTWMAQKPNALPRVFVIKYLYDFQGNVGTVSNLTYDAAGKLLDQFYHHYDYDKDKRLSKASTSAAENGEPKVRAQYEYYLHGPLKRIVLGDNLQGIDFVYNINGWLTQINHPDKTQDPGHDGAGNGVKEDVFGMVLDYYESDLSGLLVSDVANPMHDLKRRHHLPFESSETYAVHQPLIRFISPYQGIEKNISTPSFKEYGVQNPRYKKVMEEHKRN